MFQYHSAKTGRKTWLQVTLSYGYDNNNGQVCRVFGIPISSAETCAHLLFSLFRIPVEALLSRMLFGHTHLILNG
jgi:hypothetical protein